MAEENSNQANKQKSAHSEREEKILKFWNEKDIFRKSVEHPAGLEKPRGDFVFYDGPPFATGLPHFGHVLPTSIKDVIPRYKTMRGYRVRRRWGWDCHGLPVENLIEKELGLKTKKDIIDYGIGRFNAAARDSVMRYANDWKTIIPRLGRWVDMEGDYRTMDASYTESVWWAFKNLHDKDLILESFKAMQICPHCETTLANFEVNQGYKDITDISVYAKFELADHPDTFFIAWTTTPWTLPGNVALAVGPDIEYVKVKTEKGTFILAKDRLAHVLKDLKYEIVGTMKGSELVGRAYKPLFDYYAKDLSLKNRENGWKIYAADFVTTTDGTGIVHIAPAFGADDMELGKKYNLPFVQHVGMDGRFKKEVTDFAGVMVKPKSSPEEKDAHQKGDVEIIKKLGPALFAKEKIVHSYPHCWRCDTPLLNYATSSWFVKVPEFAGKLVSENKKVHWVSQEVGEGRFGNWLLGARAWAISRSRFWGAPLPVWRTREEDAPADASSAAPAAKKIETVVIGSITDLKKYSKPQNEYFLIRHGEADNNALEVISSKEQNQHHLTENGRVQAAKAAEWLAAENAKRPFDYVYISPFVRTRETAEIIAKKLGIAADRIIIEPQIGELNAGEYEGIPFRTFMEKFRFEKRFDIRPPGGENYVDVKKRMGDFLYGLEKKYSGKKEGKEEGQRILIVSHDSPLSLLVAAAQGLDRAQTIDMRGRKDHYILNAKPFRLDFTPVPHNEEYELDLHRPFIDDFAMKLPDGRKLVRVEEVFDCWFESGSMPFGEAHYPFCNDAERADTKEFGLFQPKSGLFKKSKGFPADFIAEGQDQTRGWFYSMLVLGTALFGRSPYKNVIVNGIVLAEDGQKLSKSKKNYPDLMPVVDKYSADALRFYLLASPLVRAQEFAFAERGVDEVAKKHIGRLANVVTFYELYALPEKSADASSSSVPVSFPASTHVLDRWMDARMNQLTEEVTRGLEAYELDRAARPFADFIDDLSTWYVRRSRDRFKEDGSDKYAALAMTRRILLQTAKLLAPFMPFLAEDIYKRMKGSTNAKHGTRESVHLEAWPTAGAVNQNLLKNMAETRRLASLALEARMKAKLNVRQPLAKLSVKKTPASATLTPEFLDLIREEINVKEIALENSGDAEISLDTAVTPELKEEGNVREFIRTVQDLRKKKNLTISDMVVLKIVTDDQGKAFIERNKAGITKAAGLTGIECAVEFYGGEETAIDSYRFGLSIL